MNRSAAVLVVSLFLLTTAVACPALAPDGPMGAEKPEGRGNIGGGAAEIDIRPRSIYRQGGPWVFLVTGLDRHELASASLTVGQTPVVPSEYREAGAGRVLCFFDYPDVPAETTPQVTVHNMSGQQKSVPLTVRALDHPTEEERQGGIQVRLRTGTIDWTPVPRSGPYRFVERSLQEVTIRDSLLALVLAGFQVLYVHKAHSQLADGDSVITRRTGSTAVIRPEERSSYDFAFPLDIPNTAAAEAVLECPSVLEAWASRAVIRARSGRR